MTQRHTFLFGAVLAVAGAAVAADHYRNGPDRGDATQNEEAKAEAPAAAPAPRAANIQNSTESGIIEFAPCSANMDGLMAAPRSAPKPATAPAPVPVPDAKSSPASKPETAATPATKPAPAPKPAPKPAPATPQQDGIIEFAPCAAAF